MSPSEPRMTRATLLVLGAFMDDTSQEVYGSKITEAVGLASGTIHPILARFEALGWLESRWEEPGQVALGRPRRRLYKITPKGVVGAARALARAETKGSRFSSPQFSPRLAEGST